MATPNINITMKLIDGVSANADRVNSKLKEIEKSANQVSRNLGQASKTLAFFSAGTITPFAIALKGVESHSNVVRNELRRTSDAFFQLQKTIAEAALPALSNFNDVIGRLSNALNLIDPKLLQQAATFTLYAAAITAVVSAVLLLGSKIVALGNLFIKFSGVIVAASPILLELGVIVAGVVAIFETIPDAIRLASLYLSDFLRGIASLVDALAKIPKVGDPFKGIGDQIRKSADGILESAANLAKGFEPLKPSSSVEALKKQLQGLQKASEDLGKIPPKVVPKFKDFATLASESVASIGSSFNQHLGDTLFNTITGKLKGLREVFQSFVEDTLRLLSRLIAKLIIIQTIKAFFPTAGFALDFASTLHSGGPIRKPIVAHNGLAPDEVPIIAQTGEGVLSRRGMAALGGSNNLRRLNSGRGVGGSVTIAPVITFQTWDMQDVLRNKKAVEQIVINSITKNGDVRKAMRQYA